MSPLYHQDQALGRLPTRPELPKPLSLAVACARSGGCFHDEEIDSIERMIEELFKPVGKERERLDLLRGKLLVEPIDVERAAARLRERLEMPQRIVLFEGILGAIRSKGFVAYLEARFLRTVSEKLEVPARSLQGLLPGKLSEDVRLLSRSKFLAVLDLPGDAGVTRQLLDWGLRRILSTYSDHRFTGMGEEIQSIARKRRAAAEEAHRRLLTSIESVTKTHAENFEG